MIDINNIITSSNNFALKKINVKLFRHDKMYMERDFIEDQFNEKFLKSKDFYLELLDHINPFFDLNGGTCKILIDGL